MFGLGFLPLVFGTEKQVCNILGEGGWKVLQKNRKRYKRNSCQAFACEFAFSIFRTYVVVKVYDFLCETPEGHFV